MADSEPRTEPVRTATRVPSAVPSRGGDPLVAADQVQVLAAGHVAQVHDLVVRQGCPRETAVDVVAASLLEVVDRAVDEVVVAAPRDADETLGGWLAAATARAAPGVRGPTGAAGDGSDRDALLRGALAALEPDQLAVLLARDRYDLSPRAAGAVLGTDMDGAARAVAAARLRLYAAVTGRLAIDLAGHRPHRAADAATLGSYVDGTVSPDDRVVVRRHLSGCPECDDIVSAQELVRRMVAALPLEPLDDTDASAALDPALTRAGEALPASADLIAFGGADDDTSSTGLAALAVMLIVLAGLVGLVAGAMAAR